MSLTSLMVNRATIQRRSAGVDRLGQPVDTWTDVATNVRCRITAARGGVQATDRSGGTVVATHSVYFLPGVTIREADRITDIKDGTGNVVLDEQLAPVLVRPVQDGEGHLHHIEVSCTVYRGLAA